MSNKPDGGPAFPIPAFENHEVGPQYPVSGMTLRDYFAAKALTGLSAHPHGEAGQWKNLASDAYAAADAMIEARGPKVMILPPEAFWP